MISFGNADLLLMEILFSPLTGKPRPKGAECPAKEHQHIRLVFREEGKPDFPLHVIGNPDDGEDWKVHSETDQAQFQASVEFLQTQAQKAGIDLQFQMIDPNNLPPGVSLPTADADEDEEEYPGGMYL